MIFYHIENLKKDDIDKEPLIISFVCHKQLMNMEGLHMQTFGEKWQIAKFKGGGSNKTKAKVESVQLCQDVR